MSSTFLNPLFSPQAPAVFKLKIYYYALELLGVIIPVVIGVLIVYFPDYFTWFGDHTLEGALSLLSIGIVHSILFILNEIFKKNFIFTLARYAYVIFFIYFIYITGGVDSSFIFLLFFPIITSAVYLDKKTTSTIGLVVTMALAALILFVPRDLITPALITKHATQVILVAVISYLVYSMVIETLNQKYEKEDFARSAFAVFNLISINSPGSATNAAGRES